MMVLFHLLFVDEGEGGEGATCVACRAVMVLKVAIFGRGCSLFRSFGYRKSLFLVLFFSSGFPPIKPYYGDNKLYVFVRFYFFLHPLDDRLSVKLLGCVIFVRNLFLDFGALACSI